MNIWGILFDWTDIQWNREAEVHVDGTRASSSNVRNY